MSRKKRKQQGNKAKSAGPLTRKEKKEVIALAKQLDQEVPWLVYKHQDKLNADIQWTLSDGGKELRAHLKLRKHDRDLIKLRDQVCTLDTLLDTHLGNVRKSPRRRYVESLVVALLIALFIRTFLFEPFKIPSGSMMPTLMVGDHLFVSKFIYGVNVPFTDTFLMDWRKPARGEVIVFEHPNPRPGGGDILIKRIVAVAGDRWRIANNVVYINGEPLGPPAVLTRRSQCMLQPGESCVWADVSKPDETKNGCLCGHFEEQASGYTWTTQHIATDVICGCRTPEPEGDQLIEHVVFNRPDAPEDVLEKQVPDGHVLVLGDNRDNSDDGRFWGTVPLANIKGKAQFIWFATENFMGRWLRTIH